jgi:VWFA-related protein
MRFLLFAALTLSPASGGQAPPPVRESVTVSVVEVPVTVVDRDGNPIRGLTAANFRVVDEGKERPVVSFDAVDFASLESLTATSPLNPAARRNFMLLFDLSFSSPTSIARAQQAARDFVTKMVQRRDRVSVATIDAARGFRVITAFTTDRVLLSRAISHPRTFIGTDPLQIAGAASGLESPEEASSDSNRATMQSETNEMTRRLNRVEDQYNRDQVNRQLDMLSNVARSLRAVAGQKHIVLLSEGFDPRLVQGRDAGLNAEQFRDNAAVEHGQIWNVDNDNRFGSVQSINILDRMADACRKSDVIVHAVDIKGVRSYVDAQEGFEKKSNEGLHVVANATGGTVFKNTNNIAGDFEQVIRHHEVSYVVGFNGATAEPGRFHRIAVKLVDVPAGARLSARAGYYESGHGESAVERSFSNAEVVLNDLPQEAIHVAELAAPFATTGRNSQVPVILEIRGDDLIAAARNDVATAEIFVYAFDEQGLVRDSLFERVVLDLPKVRDKLRESGLKYYGTLSLPQGSYAIKSLVRVKETETRGFTRRDVVVPHADDVAISQPLFLEEPGRWLMIKGGTHDKTNAAYPFEVDGQPFIPSAAVTVRSGLPRKFVVFVQNATPDEMTVDVAPAATVLSQLRSTTGSKLVFQLDAAPANGSILNVTMRKKGSSDARTSSVALVP